VQTNDSDTNRFSYDYVQLIVFVCDKSDTSVHMERSSQIILTG